MAVGWWFRCEPIVWRLYPVSESEIEARSLYRSRHVRSRLQSLAALLAVVSTAQWRGLSNCFKWQFPKTRCPSTGSAILAV